MGKTLFGCGFVLLSCAVACGGSSSASDDEGGSGGTTGGSGGATGGSTTSGGSGGATGGSSASGGSGGATGGSSASGGSGGSGGNVGKGGSGGTTGGSGGSGGSGGKGGSGGSGGSSGSGGSGGGIPLESMPTRISTAACKLLFECCTQAQRDANPFVGDTEAECRSNYTALFTLVVPEMNQSITKGRMRYDGVALEACMATFEAAGCSGTIDDPAECEGVFVPLVQVGGGCTQQGECIDSACIGGDATNDVDGVCGAPQANGADCTDDDECASGYCSGISCEPKVANGEVCFTDAECESDFCDPNGVCAAGSSEICE